MANTLQKTLYYISAMTPAAFVFAIIWMLQKRTFMIPAIIILAGTVLIVLFFVSFNYGKKNIAPMTIRVTEVSENDIWMLGYVISYLLPMVSLIIDDCNIWILLILVLIILIIPPFINAAIPHPLLFIKKYHFYQVATENGISSYVLISKRKIRNKKEIRAVGRIFEFLLIEK